MKFLGYLFSLIFFAIFGPGFMAVSWNRIEAECTRDVAKRVDCRITDAYFFGLIALKRTANGVRSVAHETSRRRLAHDVMTSRVAILAENGRVPIGFLSSNFGGSQKSGMVRALRGFLSSSEPAFAHSELTVSTPFLLFSIPFTALFLFSLISPFLSLRSPTGVPAKQGAYEVWTARKQSAATPSFTVILGETLKAALTPPPLPGQLPIVLDQGSDALRKIGQYLTVGILAILAGQIALYALGYLGSWMEIVISVIFARGAIFLTRQRRIELHRHRVAVSYTGWWAPRAWEEPLAHYTHIRVYRQDREKSVTFQAELVHNATRKRNLQLWVPPVFKREQAIERADRFKSLLGISVDISKSV